MRYGIGGALFVLWLAGCAETSGSPRGPRDAGESDGYVEPDADAEPKWTPPGRIGRVKPEEQRAGDPETGRDVLLNYGYITCGVPFEVYKRAGGVVDPGYAIEGRTGINATIPYALTHTVSPRGVEIVAPNCLSCHAGAFNGRMVIGLGNANADFTLDTGGLATGASAFAVTEEEKDEVRFWRDRMRVVGPRTVLDTVGLTAADNLAAVLFAHRDPQTLAWLPQPTLPYPDVVAPVDVPPWWRMRKKNALYYTASGRGDHARLMMTAAALCTDTVEEATEIDEQFVHVRAFLESLEPPDYPFPIDAELAARGEGVFEATCSRCHGYYDEDPSYPNLVIGLQRVGTDPLLATGSGFGTGVYVDWYNESFYGLNSRLEPAPGYVAPPLDGVWATAPYLHNGSVPTIALMLESTARPTYWTRHYDTNGAASTTDYDEDALGFGFDALEQGKDGATDRTERVRIYDTTRLGYGNQGHTFGDLLSAADRRAVLEYLKTL